MHGCSYKTFMNGKPHSFKGTEGVVGLKRWFEKMEQVFEICKYAEDNKVKFVCCSRSMSPWLLNLGGWELVDTDNVFQTLGLANANQIPWSNVKAMMTTEYCPATEIQRMEQELWTLTLKGDDIEAYNNRFHYELAKALSIGDRNKRKWEDTREQLSPAAKPKTKADYGLVQAPAKGSRLRWANLPWRQIGARGASSARSLVLSSEENVTRFGHQEGECRELGFLSDCPEVKEPKPRKPSLKGTEARGMVSCAIVSSYGFQRIQLEEVPCRRTISLIPLDGLHINDKLYFIEENIEIRSQKVEAKLYPKLSRSNVASSIDASSIVASSIDARSNVASSIDASSNDARSNVASSIDARSNVASSIDASSIPSRFQDSQLPDRVYKVVKAMYGLHQAPRAWYGTLSKYLLDNGFQRGTIDQTLFIRKHKGEFLLVQVFVIGSLMYLTASRPGIMFAVCACAKHQVTPKECHLHAVKRIFRYLKGHPVLGLWYPKESLFDLVAYSDSDYGGATQDRKSTTRGCQFFGRRLISWQCKKQTIVTTSTTEAEYMAVASGCGQVLWIQNQLLDYGYDFMNTKIYIDNNSAICIVKNPIYHSRTKHIEIRHYFIRDCYEKKLLNVDHIHSDDNVADLLTKAFDVGRFQYLVDEHVMKKSL
ncbi:putative ribonuclease H-like domain-containing protein [Tanacetum coccineum]